MKLLLLFSGLALSVSLAAQYPSSGIKSRLGWQTTGDGLVYRGSGAPAYSPGTMFNAWMYLDTTNYFLYMYKNFQWNKLPGLNNGLSYASAYYGQLGGTLIQNTTVETGAYDLLLGRTSGTNHAWINIYGSGGYAGLFNSYNSGALEVEITAGGGTASLLVENITDGGNSSIHATKDGFQASYLHPVIGASFFKMDSTKFRIRGLVSYASHSAADAANTEYQLYQINNSRAVYVKNGATTSQDILGSGTTDRSARWSATNTLAAGNFTDNETKVQALLPFQFQTYTTAGLPTGVTGYHVYNTTTNGPGWYQGSRWAYGLESTFNRGTSGYFPRFDANGQIIDSEARVSSTNMIIALTGGLQIPSGTSAQQSSTGAGYLRWNTSLGYPTIFNGSVTESVLTGPFTGFAAGEVLYGESSGGMPASATTFKWDISNSRLLIGTTSHSFSNTTRLVVQQATSNAFIADFRQTSSTAFAPLAIMKLTRTDNTVGYGGSFAFYFNNSTSGEVDYARFGALIESNTASSHTGALAFYTTNLGTTAQERLRLTGIGRLGINTTTPTHRLHVNGRVRIDTTDATPTSIIGVDGNNVLGKFTLGSGLSISSGTLSATGTGGTVTSVGLSLPSVFSVSGSPVTSSGTLSATFTGGNTRQVLRGDGVWANTLDSFRINQSLASVERFEVNGNLVLSREDQGHKLMLSRGWSQQIWGGGSSGDMTYQNGSGAGFQNYFVLGTSAGTDTAATMHSSGLGVYIGKYNKIQARLHVKGSSSAGSSKTALFEDVDGTDIFTIIDNGRIQAHGYGAGTKEAADLSKTQSNYIAGFATDGTVLDLERKRDTTIFVTADTDYDFSAAVTTAQIGSRYNRVIIHMTLTSGASADKTTTLHTPDANLMQCEFVIRGTDNNGSHTNDISFGTNNAISSDGTNASGYTLSAGQGLHVRVVYNGSAYKYIYY